MGDGLICILGSRREVINPVTDTKSPTANNSTDCNGFTNPSRAHASDNSYATFTGDLGVAATMYQTFGFAIPAGKKITLVELLLESSGNQSGITHLVEIGKPGTPDTCGNFVTFPEGAAIGSVVDPFGEEVRVFDVTNTGHAWVPSDFDNANLRFLLTAAHGIV